MTRLAVFLPELRAGGAQQAILTLCPHFLESSSEVDLILACAEGPLLQRVPADVRVIDLSQGRPARTRLGFAVQAIWRLTRYLNRTRPDALLSTLTGANLVAVVASWLTKTRIRLVLREANTLENLNNRIMRLAVRLLYQRADCVIAVSTAVRNQLVEQLSLPSSRVETIFNPVDVERLAILAAESFRHPWFVSDSPPVVVTIGRLVPQKDHRTLLNAFAELRQHFDSRLLIIGEGPLRPELESQIQALGLLADIELAGMIPNPYPYVARAAIFTLTSRWEGMPNALLEAVALGIPVVSTDCPSGPREILESRASDCLVPPGDAPAIARAMLRILERAPAVSHSLLEVPARYNPRQIARAYIDILLPPPMQ